MADAGGMKPEALAGLKKWGKDKPTKDIAEHLEGHGHDEDSARALAVWIRKQAIGEETFKKHQDEARARKKKEGK